MAKAHPCPAIPVSLCGYSSTKRHFTSDRHSPSREAACTHCTAINPHCHLSHCHREVHQQGGYRCISVSFSFCLNSVKYFRWQLQKPDFQPTWYKIRHFRDYVCFEKMHSTKTVLCQGLARGEPYWGIHQCQQYLYPISTDYLINLTSFIIGFLVVSFQNYFCKSTDKGQGKNTKIDQQLTLAT